MQPKLLAVVLLGSFLQQLQVNKQQELVVAQQG
jgi:hypothetical protein